MHKPMRAHLAALLCLSATACAAAHDADAALDAATGDSSYTDLGMADAPTDSGGGLGAACGLMVPCVPPLGCAFTSGGLCLGPACPHVLDSECPTGFVCVGMPSVAFCDKPCGTDADCYLPLRCGYSHDNMGDRRLTCQTPVGFINPGPLSH